MRQILILALLVVAAMATPASAQYQSRKQVAVRQMQHQRWVAARQQANQREKVANSNANSSNARISSDDARNIATALVLGAVIVSMSDSGGVGPAQVERDPADIARQRMYNRDRYLEEARRHAAAGNEDAARSALRSAENP